MRSPTRRRHVTLAALFAGVLVTAGCGGSVSGKEASDAEELFLQRATVRGPDPFTESTAVLLPKPPAAPSPSSTGGDSVRAARILPGSTPGLYAGARSVSSCDVERQIRLLTENRTKSRAFARGAGIGQGSMPAFLRGLTPVALRADTRMTNYGYRSGSATAFQSVLQAGTAVMVDDHGMPRVRCICGNPLGPAVPARGGVVHRGRQWAGYRPGRIVVINRTARAVDSLVIVSIPDGTWLERRTGTRGEEDKVPTVAPPYGPDADITDPNAVQPPLPDGSSGSPEPEPPGGTPTGGPDAPSADCPPPGTGPAPGESPAEPPSVQPGCPSSDPGDGPSPPDVRSEPPSEQIPPDPPQGSASELYPPGDGDGMLPDPEQTSVELIRPDGFQG